MNHTSFNVHIPDAQVVLVKTNEHTPLRGSSILFIPDPPPVKRLFGKQRANIQTRIEYFWNRRAQ